MVAGAGVNTASDLDAAMQCLIKIEPRFAHIYETTGPLPLRRRAGGFAAVAQTIVGQQVSTASAKAIWARVQQAGFDDPATVNAAGDQDLAQAGLSRPKIKYFKALAQANLPYDQFEEMPDDAVISSLVAVKGIGPWTAQIYAMFSLGRMDVFADGDIALQEATKVIFDLPVRPNAKDMAQRAEAWSPYRAVAARLLWAYYAKLKHHEGIIT